MSVLRAVNWNDIVELGHAMEAAGVEPIFVKEVCTAVVVAGPEGYAEVDVVGIVKMDNGQYVAFEAGCDTTGWDCQADGSMSAGCATYEEALAWLPIAKQMKLAVGI